MRGVTDPGMERDWPWEGHQKIFKRGEFSPKIIKDSHANGIFRDIAAAEADVPTNSPQTLLLRTRDLYEMDCCYFTRYKSSKILRLAYQRN